jgi:hypothetical protein
MVKIAKIIATHEMNYELRGIANPTLNQPL